MDDREQIRKHYNQIPNRSINERRNLRNLTVRNTNNFIKQCLIKKYVQRLDIILDLGIGKGGDFRKYDHLGIREVYGLDIANRSILDALERAREGRYKFHITLKVKDCFSTEFDLKKKFDVVTAQFSFHYCFAKEKYLDTTLSNIDRHLKPGGYFIMTIPSKREILKRLERNRLSNELFKIEFKNKDSKEIFGNAYYYTLVDSVNDCVEYLVDIDVLKEKTSKKGWILVEETPFQRFYEDSSSLYGDLFSKLVRREPTPTDMEVITLHDVVVFKKV